MPSPVNSILVLVASPGDALEERATVRDALNDWSVTSGMRQGVVLLPWLYERHSVARLGGRPQAIINAQAVDRSDIVIAFFDARLGTDTGVDFSGTAEEIRRALDLGKPVHVYFSREDIPRDADLSQVAALNEFKLQLQQEGLLGDYTDPGDLSAQIVRAIEADITDQGWGEALVATGRTGAQLAWEHVRVVEQTGVDAKGKIKTRTRRNELVVRNDSGTDAEDLTFDVTNADSSTDNHFRFDGPSEPVTVHARSERQWMLIPLQTLTLRIDARWTENGIPRTRTTTVVTR